MKKRINRLIGIVLFCFLLVYSCKETKNYTTVDVRGRLIHQGTQLPAQYEISLYADDVYSGKSSGNASIKLATTTSGTDGRFSLKSNASKDNKYYLRILYGTSTIFVGNSQGFSVTENGITELGDIAD